MVDDRNQRGPYSQRDYPGRDDSRDRSRDYGSGRDYSQYGTSSYGDRDDDRGGYGRGEYGHARYDQPRDDGRGYGGDRDAYRGSYGSEGRRFEHYGSDRDRGDDRGRERSQGGYGRQPQGYDYEDRGFLARAGDEVRSWFGDEDAERRRDRDAHMDERYANDRDQDYHSWRRGQIDALDRDYHEYRQENRSRFQNEFAAWRTARQGQRDSLRQVQEHQEVVGSDGTHVGTVDKIRGDRIILTKNDKDAGGHHHSIPSRWINTVSDKVTLSKTAAEAKQAWRDEEENHAMFGRDRDRDDDSGRGTNLNRSFPGTY